MPEHFCANLSDDCPPEVCCDIQTEETCFNKTTWDPIGCARFDEGGCPCPDGEVKCGANEFSSGYCTTVCCDWTIEQTCYDGNGEPLYCKKYEDGACDVEGDTDLLLYTTIGNSNVEESGEHTNDAESRPIEVRPGATKG